MTSSRICLFLLASVLPVALWTGSTSYESAKFLLWALAAAVWLAMFGVSIFRRRPLTAPPRGFSIAFVALVLIMLPGLWRASAPLLVVRSLLWTGIWALTAAVTSRALRDGRDLYHLLWCAAGGVAVVCLYGVLQIAQVLPGPGEWNVPKGISTLGNENYVAELAAVWLVPSVLLVTGARRGALRLFAGVPMASMLTMLAMSTAAGARVGALAAITFGVVGLVLGSSRWKRRAPLVLAALCLSAAVIAGSLMQPVLAPHYAPETGATWTARIFAHNHGDIRRTDWLVADRLWRSSPALGCGIGNYGVHWLDTRAALTSGKAVAGLAEGAPTATRAHHEYLQLAAELGWAGVIWLAVVLVAAAIFWARLWLDAPDQQARRTQLLLVCGLVATGVIALVSFPLHLPVSALAFALIAGALGSPAIGAASARPLRAHAPRWVAIVPAAAGLVLAAAAVLAFSGDRSIARGTRSFIAGAPRLAVAPLRAGIARLPWPNDARLYLGLALDATEQPDDALDSLTASLHDRPTFEAYLAMAEIHLDARRFDRVPALLDKVENCRPARTFLQQAGYLRALMSLRQQQWDEARARFERLAVDDPMDHRSWLGLGYLNALQGNRDVARACYGRAIKALEEELAGPAPATAAARGQATRWRAQLETARRALASVTD